MVCASATALPVPTASVEVVVCSMALQVLDPLPAALAEIRRVLVPGGRMVAILPARRPLRVGDLPVLAGLLGILGRRLTYPSDQALRQLPELLEGAGLRLAGDQRRRLPTRCDRHRRRPVVGLAVPARHSHRPLPRRSELAAGTGPSPRARPGADPAGVAIAAR